MVKKTLLFCLISPWAASAMDFSLIPVYPEHSAGYRPQIVMVSRLSECARATLLLSSAEILEQHRRHGLTAFMSRRPTALIELRTSLTPAQLESLLQKWVLLYCELTEARCDAEVRATLEWVFVSLLGPEDLSEIQRLASRPLPLEKVTQEEEQESVPPQPQSPVAALPPERPQELLVPLPDTGSGGGEPHPRPDDQGVPLVSQVNIQVVLMPDPRSVEAENRRRYGYASRSSSPHRGSILPAHNYDRHGHLVNR